MNDSAPQLHQPRFSRHISEMTEAIALSHMEGSSPGSSGLAPLLLSGLTPWNSTAPVVSRGLKEIRKISYLEHVPQSLESETRRSAVFFWRPLFLYVMSKPGKAFHREAGTTQEQPRLPNANGQLQCGRRSVCPRSGPH